MYLRTPILRIMSFYIEVYIIIKKKQLNFNHQWNIINIEVKSCDDATVFGDIIREKNMSFSMLNCE